MLEWLIAIAALGVFLALLPRMLRRAKAAQRKAGGGSGVMVGIGLGLAMIFDSKATQAMEVVDKKQDECEDEESGEKPRTAPAVAAPAASSAPPPATQSR